MSTEILFSNVGRKFTKMVAIYKPEVSVSGLHDGGHGEFVKGKRTLVNGVIKLTKAGEAWCVGTCVDKGGPASFSTREDGVKKILEIVWA